MKTIFLALLFVAGAFARAGNQITETGPACPLDDPLISESGFLNITLDPILVINAGGSRGELVAVGLTTLNYEYNVNIILLTADVEINLGSLKLDVADYNAEGWVDVTPLREETLPSGSFVGTGNAALTASNVNVKFSATLFINLISNKVTVRLLNVENLSFDSVTLDLGAGFLLDGAAVDWATLSANFKDNFAQDWAASEEAIVEKIRTAANVVVGQYTLDEILDIIGNIGGGDGGEGCTTGAH